MSNSMFFTGLSGLNAAQAALVTTGQNTANVNTPGYNRQSAEISSAGGTFKAGVGFFGNGAKVVNVTRSYDQYLTAQFNQAQSSNQALSSYYTQISQIDNLLANQKAGLAPQLQTFFSNVQTVANTPADPAARQQLLSSSEGLANQFRTMDQYLTSLNANVNDQVAGSVDQINAYAEQIASLNKQVAMLSNGNQLPNDLLDQRDQLVNELGKLMGTKLVVQDGGQYNVFIGNGQTLVLGDKATRLAAVNSASDPSRTTLAVINAAGNKVELQESVIAGGSIGGLLQFRNEALTTSQNSLGRMAIVLADTFNAQQKLGIDLNGTLGEDFFSQAVPGVVANGKNTLPAATMTANFSDIGKLTTSDYRVVATGVTTFTVTRLSDNAVVGPVAGAYDGLTLGLAGATVGDSFLIQPTRAGARDLAVVLTDPAKVAAASPVITGNTFGNQGSGAISAGSVDASYLGTPLAASGSLTYNSATTTFSFSGFLPALTSVTVTPPNSTPIIYPAGSPVPYSAGAKMTFNGITVTVSGAPSNGDNFTVAKNSGGVSDGSNALLLGGLQNKKTVGNGTASFNDAFGQLVSSVGNKTRQLQIASTAQTSLTMQIRAVQQSVSGVNQDEETANLLMFQQMYQANAKVIQTASTLFDAVLGIR